MNEDKFQDAVYSWLVESFVEVEAEVTLDGSHHRVDFIAYTPFDSYVIEVEDSWESIYNGLGQSMLYAAETGHEPVLVFPADDDVLDDFELGLLREDDTGPRIVTV